MSDVSATPPPSSSRHPQPPAAPPGYYTAITLYSPTLDRWLGVTVQSATLWCSRVTSAGQIADSVSLQGSDGKLPYLPAERRRLQTDFLEEGVAVMERHGGSTPRRVWASHYISPSNRRGFIPVPVTRCFSCRKRVIYRSFVDAIKSPIELKLIWVNAYVVLEEAAGRGGHLLLLEPRSGWHDDCTSWATSEFNKSNSSIRQHTIIYSANAFSYCVSIISVCVSLFTGDLGTYVYVSGLHFQSNVSLCCSPLAARRDAVRRGTQEPAQSHIRVRHKEIDRINAELNNFNKPSRSDLSHHATTAQ